MDAPRPEGPPCPSRLPGHLPGHPVRRRPRHDLGALWGIAALDSRERSRAARAAGDEWGARLHAEQARHRAQAAALCRECARGWGIAADRHDGGRDPEASVTAERFPGTT